MRKPDSENFGGKTANRWDTSNGTLYEGVRYVTYSALRWFILKFGYRMFAHGSSLDQSVEVCNCESFLVLVEIFEAFAGGLVRLVGSK